MFLLRILTMRRQLDLLDHQLDRLRTLTGRKA